MAKQLAKSGLLPAIQDAAKLLAGQLQPQVPHAATRSAAAPAAPAVAATKGLQLLAYACLSTINTLVQCWPGKLLVGARLAPCVVPVASLAKEVLSCRLVPGPAVSLENDGSSSSSSGRGAASSSGNSRSFQFGSSSFIGRSLSFDVFAAAAQLPGNLAQRIGADIAPESAGGAPNLYTDNDATHRLESAELFFMLGCNLAQEASRNADEDSFADEFLADFVDGLWHTALAGILVLLETALLQGSSSAAERLQQLLQCSRTLRRLVPELQRGLAQATGLEETEPEEIKGVAQLQEAVLLELAPAVQRCVADAAAESAAAGSAAASAPDVGELQQQLCQLLMMGNFPLPPASNALLDHPARAFHTCEWLLRFQLQQLAATEDSALFEQQQQQEGQQQQRQQHHAQRTQYTIHDLQRLCFACLNELIVLLSHYTERHQGTRQGSPQQQQQLEQQQVALLLLRARALAVLGRVLPRVHSADSIRDVFELISQQSVAASWACLGEKLLSDEIASACECAEAMGASLRSIQLPGEAAAAAAARQQLLLAFEDTLAVLPASELNTRSRIQPSDGIQRELRKFGDLSQQLQQFGDAVCCQLPFAWWCCNPCCTSVQGASEQVPVAWKSCLCARCRTARFCSRECITQCWKDGHRKVCKRIAAAATA
uniref:MYND-type domain-containing protein n=1 Tax=Tetradesmus obliquus TaxID=3088 RepID=A0A383WNM5_TETOB|eukprot:jgi/Sobl393_1/18451/SZX78769.1